MILYLALLMERYGVERSGKHGRHLVNILRMASMMKNGGFWRFSWCNWGECEDRREMKDRPENWAGFARGRAGPRARTRLWAGFLHCGMEWAQNRPGLVQNLARFRTTTTEAGPNLAPSHVLGPAFAHQREPRIGPALLFLHISPQLFHFSALSTAVTLITHENHRMSANEESVVSSSATPMEIDVPSRKDSYDDELVQKLSTIELLPELFSLLHSLQMGELQAKDFDNNIGVIRQKLSNIRQILLEVEGIEEPLKDREARIQVLRESNESKRRFLEQLKQNISQE